jgi:hypothetical protein
MARFEGEVIQFDSLMCIGRNASYPKFPPSLIIYIIVLLVELIQLRML